jgi:hypothetical protein
LQLGEFADAVLGVVQHPVALLTPRLEVQQINGAFRDMLKVDERQTRGAPVLELADGRLDDPDLRRLLETEVTLDGAPRHIEIDHDVDGVSGRIRITAQRFDGSRNAEPIILMAITPVA